MPTYNYYCNTCDTHFSYFQKMSELPFSKCENCGEKINRLITGGTGLIFKGSGFYLTDYKNKSEHSENVKQGESKKEKDGTKQKVEKKEVKLQENTTKKIKNNNE